MKTIICGGRTYHMTPADLRWLNGLRHTLPITSVVSGCAKGADADGISWATYHGLEVHRFAAQWDALGLGAGLARNTGMANFAEACVAFPGGTGTADMVRKAHQKGLQVLLPPHHDITPTRPVIKRGGGVYHHEPVGGWGGFLSEGRE